MSLIQQELQRRLAEGHVHLILPFGARRQYVLVNTVTRLCGTDRCYRREEAAGEGHPDNNSPDRGEELAV